jgi:hypothetical protein
MNCIYCGLDREGIDIAGGLGLAEAPAICCDYDDIVEIAA